MDEPVGVRSPGRFVVIGNSVVDVYLRHLAAWPTEESVRSITGGLEYYAGGNGLNVAVALCLLDPTHPVTLLSATGSGGHSAMLRDACRQFSKSDSGHVGSPSGLTTHWASCSGEHASTSLVRILPNGGAEFVHFPGATKCLDLGFLKRYRAVYRDADYLHIGGVGLLPSLGFSELQDLLTFVRDANKSILISLDVNLLTEQQANGQQVRERLHNCLNMVDYLLVNEKEARQYSGRAEMNEAIASFNASVKLATIVKRGAAGVVLGRRGERPQAINSYAMHFGDIPVVDTVGAGDVWVAAFICSLANGTDDRVGCKVGNLAAAHAVRAWGPTSNVKAFEWLAEIVRTIGDDDEIGIEL